ncbi:MAG: ABC transporter ATP-binding protein [Treponema sp.]|jgi:oligopeptide/dipeptide ABC transporter ATP-binding protein|nr:ABC transporter ATP-binding protein [Treponema sp.]
MTGREGDVILEVKSLSKSFRRNSRQAVRAVENVSFSIYRGEFFGIVGESGCGKSTLGRLIPRLIEPSGGQVFFNGEEVTAASRKRLSRLRPLMQMIFQNPFASFDPKMTLGSSLREAALFHGLPRKAAQARILELLGLINLSADVLSRLPKEISGGQLQRLAIVRALIPSPPFIIADEPVSALDVSVQAQLLNLLYDLKERLDLTVIFISHDIQVVEYLCDRTAVMYMGSMVEIAGAEELFDRPLHPYTRALISAAPRLETGGGKRELLGGDPPSPFDDIPGCRFSPRCPRRGEACLKARPVLAEGGDGHSVACHFPLP